MTSFKQIAANRRNASKSTGPTTEEGKQRSRCNAVRHGIAAETAIGALEDAQDYKAFKSAITADYDAQSAVERELVLRLANLLWRLRRATAMETGLFEIQADHLSQIGNERYFAPESREIVLCDLWALVLGQRRQRPVTLAHNGRIRNTALLRSNNPSVDIARCFLRLTNLPNFALDRLSRHEAALWRQVGQTLFALDALDRRKPQERGAPFGHRQPARISGLWEG